MSSGKRPGDRLAAARLAANAAQADVAAASRNRLTELLRLPPHARLEALNDAALEPAERETLRRSLAPLLSSPTKPAPKPKAPLARHDFAVLLSWKVAALFILVAGVAVAAARSGGQRAAVTRPDEVRAVMPNGSEAWLPLARGQIVVVTSRDQAAASVRIWRAREGYASARVPLELLTAPSR